MKKLISPLSFILICLLAGAFGSLFTTSAIPDWYASLNKPSFNPPGWLFGPVWTILYILMGIAGYLISESSEKKLKKIKKVQSFFDKFTLKKRDVMIIFWVQLGLNALWSYLFFGMKNPLIALIDIILLWITILLFILTSNKLSKLASALFYPYIVWVSFATVLNASILYLN